MIVKKLKTPLYFETIQIVITNDFNKALKKNNISYNFDTNMYSAFVWIKGDITLFITPDSDISIIAHECVHIVNEIFKRCAIKLDIENDEPQAYLMGWIVKEVYDIMNKNKTIKK